MAGTDNPASITRDGAKTDFVYDYRGRVVQTKVYPYVGKTLISKKQYQNNQLFADEDPYGRKTYYGYRVSDGAMVRVVKTAYPSAAAGQTGGYTGTGFSPTDNLSEENCRCKRTAGAMYL